METITSTQMLKSVINGLSAQSTGSAGQKIMVYAADGTPAGKMQAPTKNMDDVYSKTEVNGLVDTPHQEYVTVDAYASLPVSGSTDTIYRVSGWDGSANSGAGAADDTVYSEYAWNGTQYIFLCVKSQIVEVFDITVYNSNTKYADLADALGTNGANVPQNLRKGGMSVKFVQTSDNKYVQYRFLLSDSFTDAQFTNVINWQSENVDKKPINGSRNLVESGGVRNEIDNIGEKIENIANIDEGAFSVVDAEGNIGLKYDENGLDAGVVTEHFKGLVVNEEKTRAQSAEAALSDDINKEENRAKQVETILKTETQEKTNGIKNIDGDIEGIVISDKYGNVGWKITPKVTEEDGIYYTDTNGNIIQQIKDGKQKMASLELDGDSSEHNLIVRANKVYREVNAIKDEIDNNMPALLQLTDSSIQTTKTTTIPAAQVKNGKVVRLRLHYGVSKYTPDDKDIFFEGSCKTDFSDVRFFDSNGNMLKASFGTPFNLEPYRDTKLGEKILIDSNGYIISPYNGGVGISTNNAESFTLIPNTANVTEHGSDVYNRKGIYPLMLDTNDNIYGYAGGKLYKLLASDDYATITEVLDFSWVNSNNETVYPDVQNHGMDIDINGNVYIGTYALTKYYHVDVFVSTDGGNSFTKKYFADSSLTGVNQQHVHHIHADKYSSNVYVGIDGGFPAQGPTVIRTNDGGETWEDITYQLRHQRGHDYYPVYFGTDYKLGGGECYTLGGNAIIRGSSQDNSLTPVLKGFGGCRSIADFGNDNILICGISRNRMHTENQIAVSFDKGLSWDTLLRFDTDSYFSSGDGLRDAVYTQVPLPNETEPCIILFGAGQRIDAQRIYKGGNHHYREVEILLDNITENQNLTITAKTGYLIPYPYKSVRDYDIPPVYEINFDEGCGDYISDNKGTIVKSESKVTWDISETPVRQGEYAGESTYNPFAFSAAAKLDCGVNFGKHAELDFSYNYSISFWWNEKNRKCDYTEEERYSRDYLNDGICYTIASVGDIDIFRRNTAIGIHERGKSLTDNPKNYILLYPDNQILSCSDNYSLITLVVTESDGIKFYLNGNKLSEGNNAYVAYKNTLLSAKDIVIGDEKGIGYISDYKIYNKALTDSEVLNIYKSFNF